MRKKILQQTYIREIKAPDLIQNGKIRKVRKWKNSLNVEKRQLPGHSGKSMLRIKSNKMVVSE